MVPGIRPAGGDDDDQARVATPGAAIAAGADWIVLARTVTAPADPEARGRDRRGRGRGGARALILRRR